MDENMNGNIPAENEEVVTETPVAAEEAEVQASQAQSVEEPVAAEDAPAEDVFADEAPADQTPTEETPVSGLADKIKSLPVKYLAIGGGAVLAVILALVLIFSVSSPLTVVGEGVENSFEALSENSVIALSDGVLNGGSVEVSVDMETLMRQTMGYPMGEGTASVKLYADAEENKAALEAQVELQGIALDAGAYLDEDSIAIASKSLLGKNAYGINLKDLKKNFEESEFGPEGEYSLGIEMPEEIQFDQKQMEKLTKDAETVYADLFKHVLKSVNKNASISKENETLIFAGDETKTTAVTIALDAKQTSIIITDLVEYIRDDKGIRNFLEDNIETLMTAYGDNTVEAETLIEEFYEELDFFCEDELQNLEADLEEAGFNLEVVFYITKSGKQLVGVDFAMEAEGEMVQCSLSAGPDLADLEEIVFSCDIFGEKFGMIYAVNANDKKEFSVELKATADEESAFEGSFTWDKKESDYVLEFYDGYDNYYLNGTMEQSGKKTTIFLQEAGIEDGEVIELNTTVVLSGSDKVPSVPKYEDVLTMSVEELEEVIAAVQQAAMALGGNVLG